MVQRQSLFDSLSAHHFKADRVSKTEPLILIAPQPAIRRIRFQLPGDADHRVKRIGVDRIQQGATGSRILCTDGEYMHLRYDEIGGYESGAPLHQLVIDSRSFGVMSFAVADSRQPPRSIDKYRLAHSL